MRFTLRGPLRDVQLVWATVARPSERGRAADPAKINARLNEKFKGKTVERALSSDQRCIRRLLRGLPATAGDEQHEKSGPHSP
jgi:hypothetical protein